MSNDIHDGRSLSIKEYTENVFQTMENFMCKHGIRLTYNQYPNDDSNPEEFILWRNNKTIGRYTSWVDVLKAYNRMQPKKIQVNLTMAVELCDALDQIIQKHVKAYPAGKRAIHNRLGVIKALKNALDNFVEIGPVE